MDEFEDRVASFTNWPLGLSLDPRMMAAAGTRPPPLPPSTKLTIQSGFYHSNWDTDEVTCFNCEIRIDRWASHMNPLEQHRRADSSCTYANSSFMGTFEERLASFYTWPMDIKPKPHLMAAAGFYHVNRATDKVACFCCKLSLEDWKRGDDPDVRHIVASLQGRPCEWARQLQSGPDAIIRPVPKRAGAAWDQRRKPHKCVLCRKTFRSGNQYRKHRREEHPSAGRLADTEVKGEPTGVMMLGRYRVAKPAARRVRMPGRRANAGLLGRAR